MAKKAITLKDYQERINRMLVYIQKHLDESIQLDDLAKVAALSKFHLHRIFHANMEETLNDYVRRLKLERGAGQLQHTNKTISTIAMDSGYNTPAAFTKAFKQQFGISPSAFKKIKKKKEIINKKIVKGKKMKIEPEIVNINPIRVLFLRGLGRYQVTPKQVWPTIEKYGRKKGFINEKTRRFGICYDSPEVTPEEKIRYDACIGVDETIQPNGKFGIQTIAGGKYAVFMHTGDCKNLGNTYDYIYKNWLPSSKYTLRNTECFDEYLDREAWIQGKIPTEKNLTKIYVPIE